MKTLVRTKFNYPMEEHSTESGIFFAQPGEEGFDGKTQQQFKEECDINTIVNSFLKTGELPENIKLPQYIDYEGIFDFRTAMETLMKAEEAFMELPAPLRAEFDNSPQNFLEFCNNPSNKDRMKELGLLKQEEPPPPEPEPMKVRIVPEPAAPGTSTAT